jgi:putative photosynthetic complex assembly protein
MPLQAHIRSMPRVPLLIGGLLVVTILGVIAPSPFHTPAPASSVADIVQQRDLIFIDRADGAIVATDARTHAEVAVLPIGTNGFIRGTLRALSRERKQEELGREIPFRVTTWRDGRTTLQDTATGRQIGLDAFGSTNAAAFAGMLTPATQEEKR